MKLIEIDNKRLEQMNNAEYAEFCRQIATFNFCDNVLRERMEFDSKEKFVQEFFWMVFNNVWFSPLYQSLLAYQRMVNVKAKDRWMYVSQYDYTLFCKLEELTTFQERKEYFEEHFWNEFCNMKGNKENE